MRHFLWPSLEAGFCLNRLHVQCSLPGVLDGGVGVSQCGLQLVTANSGLTLDHGLCRVAQTLWAVGFQDCDLLGIKRICPSRLSSESSCSCQEDPHLPWPRGKLPWDDPAAGAEGPGSVSHSCQVGPGRSCVPLWVWAEAEALGFCVHISVQLAHLSCPVAPSPS